MVARFGNEILEAKQEIDLISGVSPQFDESSFLAGEQTPVFFGSAINNFGIREVLDALISLAPPPGLREALQRTVLPEEKKFSGVVFKIQANMNPAHRDRIAFIRICSGEFKRGMNLKVARNNKEIRTNTAVSFLSQRREILETGYPGDIIGAPDGIDGYYYNTAFAAGGVPASCKDEHGLSTVPGSWIAMPPPVDDGSVEYQDGHDNSKHHISEDVASFLMWAAEPKMMARKQAGFVAVTFLFVLSALLYLTNKKLWSGVKGKAFEA